jgi:hypothetical protein
MTSEAPTIAGCGEGTYLKGTAFRPYIKMQ